MPLSRSRSGPRVRPQLALYWSDYGPNSAISSTKWPDGRYAAKNVARERAALASQPPRATRGGVVFGTKLGLAKGHQSAADAQDGWL